MPGDRCGKTIEFYVYVKLPLHINATADVHIVTGDIIGQIAGVEQHCVGDVLRCPVASHRDVCLGVHLRPGQRLAHGCQDIARTDGVRGDVIGCALQSKALAEIQDACLGAGVGSIRTPAAPESCQRRHMDQLAI